MRTAVRSFTVVVAGMLAAGCGEDTPTSPVVAFGTFRGTLSGDATGPRTGKAEFDTTGYDVFAIEMIGDAGVEDFIFSVGMPGPARSDVGTFSAEESDFWGGVYLGGNDYFIESGTLTITASSDTLVSGTFNVTCFDNITDETVIFRGSFRARARGSEFGSFNATYTGAINGSSEGGRAFFQVTSGDFLLNMETGTTWGDITIAGNGAGRLGVGSYAVGDGANTPLSATVPIDANAARDFHSTGGTVTVSASSSTSITGTFSIDLKDAGGTTMRVTGSFRANCPGTQCG